MSSSRFGSAVDGQAAGVSRAGVLLAIDSLTTGGAERHLVDLACGLDQRGHDVTVACSADGELRQVLDAHGIPVHLLADALVKRRVCLRYAGRLRELLFVVQSDVVHAHLFAIIVPAAHATLGTDVPFVATEQTEALWRDDRALEASRFAYRRAAHVIGVSSAICRTLTHDDDVPVEKVSFVPNSVHSASAGLIAPLPPGRPLVGTIARLVPEKGVDTLLRAAQRLRAVVPGVQFVVAGDGPLRDGLRSLAAELRLDGVVHFLGRRPDGPALISHLDVLAVPSLSEGTPLVIAEALRAGTPIVATPVGGIPDQIRDGQEGLLVPVGDDQALADALAAVLLDRELAARLRRAGSRRSEEFSQTVMVERIARILRDAARSGRPSGGRPASPATDRRR